MNHLKTTLPIILSLLIFVSCGSNKKPQEESTDTFDIQDYIKAAESIDPDLDHVDQVFTILDMVEAGYYDVLTNDPYSAHSYKTSKAVAAANLGVYMADIVYHLYGESDESMFITFQAAQELAKHIGVQSEFASWTIENLEGSMMKRDTITMLFNQLLEDSKKYSSEEEMVFIHTAFLTGSFVEKVYFTSSILKQKMQDDDITQDEEGNIRKLLVIYLNQLDPSTGILYDAFNQQKDQLQGLVILNTFEKLKELAAHLQETKSVLAVAPISELSVNKDLTTTFELISNLRTVLITPSV